MSGYWESVSCSCTDTMSSLWNSHSGNRVPAHLRSCRKMENLSQSLSPSPQYWAASLTFLSLPKLPFYFKEKEVYSVIFLKISFSHTSVLKVGTVTTSLVRNGEICISLNIFNV